MLAESNHKILAITEWSLFPSYLLPLSDFSIPKFHFIFFLSLIIFVNVFLVVFYLNVLRSVMNSICLHWLSEYLVLLFYDVSCQSETTECVFWFLRNTNGFLILDLVEDAFYIIWLRLKLREETRRIKFKDLWKCI